MKLTKEQKKGWEAVPKRDLPLVWVSSERRPAFALGMFFADETNAEVVIGPEPPDERPTVIVSWGEPADIRQERLAARYRIPELVLEYGFIGRPESWEGGESVAHEGYFQACWGGLNRLPVMPAIVDDTRLRVVLGELGKEVAETRTDGEYVLVCGQVPDDAQHRLDNYQLSRWLIDRVKAYMRDAEVGLESLRWRGHPMAPHFNVWPLMEYQTGTLSEGLAKAKAVITYNSGAGIKAMIDGIPVMCAPKAHYAAFANGPANVRAKYLAHLANNQWSPAELEFGYAFDSIRGSFMKSFNRMFPVMRKNHG